MSAVTDLTEARREVGLEPNGDPPDLAVSNGRSIAERATERGEDAPEPEQQEELFVLEQGKKVTLSQLIGRNTPIEYRFNLNSKGLSGGGDMGLVPFNEPHLTLVVPVRAGKVVTDPTYRDDGTIEKVRITAYFKPQTAYDSRSAEARAALGLE